MLKQIFLSCILFYSFSILSFPQDLNYTRKVIDTLCSNSMFGRGYLKNGNRLAANYIFTEFQNIGLSLFNDSCFQPLSYPVNTIPGKFSVAINEKILQPAKDYYVMARSASCKGTFQVIYYNYLILSNPDSLRKFEAIDFSDKFILIDKTGTQNKDTISLLKQMRSNPKKAKGIINVEDKINWNVSSKAETFTDILIAKPVITNKVKSITTDIETVFIDKFSTQNIVAFIKGSEKPDSFIVFTAHYDHLGGMGDSIYIPGANDNASGVSMLFNFAKYYKEHPAKFSIVLIAFTGEEAGLLGSSYFVLHPWFALDRIKVLLNLDMVGTGDEGIMLVNGAVFTDLFNRFVEINKIKSYVKKIEKRGEAKNSDHYPFYANGVKCFFIYTLGGISEYHNPWDKASTLPLTKYKELFHLILDFTDTF